MESPIAGAKSFTDLLQRDDEGPYAFSRMFSAETRKDRRRSKRTFKLLQKVDEPLRAMLEDGERVSFLTRGVAQPSFLEWYFLGWALYYMQQRAIAVTNRRILLIQITSRGRPKEMRNQISYTAVKEIKKTVLGNIVVRFRSGKKAMLTGIPRTDRKRFAEIFQQGFSAFDAMATQTEIEALCPHCYASVAGHPEACPTCAGLFKSAKTAARLSLIFPGAGDIYLGHTLFALLEIGFASVFWLSFTVVTLDPTVGLVEGLVVLGVMALFVHGADAFTTGHMARKGLLPAEGPAERWRYGVAAVVPVVGLAVVIGSAPGKTQLRPDIAVVAGADLPVEHLDALRTAGYVGEGETVHYFYSLGPSTVLQDGNLFTDERIVSYAADVDTVWVSTARFDDVVDLETNFAQGAEDLSSVYVVTTDGQVFYLVLGTEGGGDRVFADAMVDHWRNIRMAGEGVWFDGGAGTSEAEAIVIRGVGDARDEELEGFERWWLRAWFGTEGVDWTYLGREISEDGSDRLSVVTIEGDGTGRMEVVFRVER